MRNRIISLCGLDSSPKSSSQSGLRRQHGVSLDGPRFLSPVLKTGIHLLPTRNCHLVPISCPRNCAPVSSVTVKSLSKSTTSPAASDPLPSGSSGADANTLVDKIAETFADILPPAWITRGIRQRIARVEYEAVSDQSRLIPEQRIADIWNE